ncbi:nitroreductase [bacterium]|jgi:nitroreductase|nr:nitroreductase [bacterium]
MSDAVFNLDQTIQTRRSVRGFFSDRPVPPDVLHEALDLARWSPSNCNVQPWEVFIASGKTRDQLRDALKNAVLSGQAPDPTTPIDTFDGEHRRRQIACAVEMYGKMGIARDDSTGRLRAHLRNFEFFDAPHIAVVCMKKSFGIGVALDVGMWVQTLMLALWARGVGCCAQASLRLYPTIIKERLGIGDDLEILCGISFGYEDPSVPANQARQPREPLSAQIHFRD